MGLTYQVSIVQQKDWTFDEECVGLFMPQQHQIKVLFNEDPATMEHVFLHELMHAILYCMGRDKLYRDEPFVDVVAGLLQQALNP